MSIARSASGRVLAGQHIREVGARELRHHAAEVVRSVRAGERLVLTRHGRPQAVLFSLDDALELLVEAELPALEAEAEQDFREGFVEAVEPPGPCPVVLSRAAANAYARMKPRDRFELRHAVARGQADEGRPVWLKSQRWIVSVSYLVAEDRSDTAAGAETVVVCAAFEVRELERELIGEEIWRARAVRDRERRMHARDLARLPESADAR